MGQIPRVPVRHWVVTLPEPWRTGLVADPAAIGRLRQTVMRELLDAIEATATQREGVPGFAGGLGVVHRGGASLDPNVHVHSMLLDGAFVSEEGRLRFVPAPPPSEATLREIASRLHARLVPQLGEPPPISLPPPRRRVTAPRATRTPAPASARPPIETSGAHRGLRVHVGPGIAPDDRPGLARVAGYLTRPTIDRSAISTTPGGAIRYRLHRPRADGPTHVEMPVDDFRRRVELIAPDRAHVSFHGVLAPRSAHRGQVVPKQMPLVEGERRPRPRPKDPRPRPRPEIERADPSTLAAQPPVCERCDAPMSLRAVEFASRR